MGVWGRMSDETRIHIDYSVKKNCWNLQASCYGNCYDCGCCAKDKRERYENRIQYLNEMIEEERNFDAWDDEPEWREIQEKNRNANIRWLKKRLRYYTRRLNELDVNRND